LAFPFAWLNIAPFHAAKLLIEALLETVSQDGWIGQAIPMDQCIKFITPF
jgi:hypothetical protein